MEVKSIEEQMFDKKFKELYNAVKFSPKRPIEEQDIRIIRFFKHILKGYEKGWMDIKDVGSWGTTTRLMAYVGSDKPGTFYGDLGRLGYKYGDSFDMGENWVKETWGTSWDEAEKKYIQRLRDFIERYDPKNKDRLTAELELANTNRHPMEKIKNVFKSLIKRAS